MSNLRELARRNWQIKARISSFALIKVPNRPLRKPRVLTEGECRRVLRAAEVGFFVWESYDGGDDGVLGCRSPSGQEIAGLCGDDVEEISWRDHLRWLRKAMLRLISSGESISGVFGFDGASALSQVGAFDLRRIAPRSLLGCECARFFQCCGCDHTFCVRAEPRIDLDYHGRR